GTVILADSSATNEIQSLTRSNDTLYLSNGGFVKLPFDADSDSTNELQTLTISNDTVYLTNGGFVKLPFDADSDSTNEIQNLSISGGKGRITLSNGGSVVLADSSAT